MRRLAGRVSVDRVPFRSTEPECSGLFRRTVPRRSPAAPQPGQGQIRREPPAAVPQRRPVIAVMTGQAGGVPGDLARMKLAPVAPATIVRVLVRPLTKILNPLMVRLADRRSFPMVQIHHVGRRSGKAYVTPTSAHVRGDMLLIALTFGNQSDWSRNVRAAGGCTVRLGGHTYRATSPELVTWADDGALIASASTRCCRLDSACSAYGSSCACTRCPPISADRTASLVQILLVAERIDDRAHHFRGFRASLSASIQRGNHRFPVTHCS